MKTLPERRVNSVVAIDLRTPENVRTYQEFVRQLALNRQNVADFILRAAENYMELNRPSHNKRRELVEFPELVELIKHQVDDRKIVRMASRGEYWRYWRKAKLLRLGHHYIAAPYHRNRYLYNPKACIEWLLARYVKPEPEPTPEQLEKTQAEQEWAAAMGAKLEIGTVSTNPADYGHEE